MALEDFKRVDDFGDAAAEARACREDCALFDFSFLECARLEGHDARGVIEAFTGRSANALREGRIFYALRVGLAGEAIADLTVWQTGAEAFEVMSGRRQDVVDLLACAGPGVDVTDVSAGRAIFAVQGPGSVDALRPLGDVGAIESLGYFNFGSASLAGVPCTIGRLGYTGEAGFEIIVARRHASDLWQALAAYARPAGFIAVDILRIEAGLALFTNEFLLPVSPREAGFGKFRRSAEMATPMITRVAFRAEADSLPWPWQPRHALQWPVTAGDIVVTSACESVIAGGILGMGYVCAGIAADAALQDRTATFRNIRLAPMPYYGPAKQRPRAAWR